MSAGVGSGDDADRTSNDADVSIAFRRYGRAASWLTAIGAENLDRETSSACLHEHPWLVILVLRGPVLGEGVYRASEAALPDDSFIQPTAIADEIWHVAHQDRYAWSFDIELRPFGETW